MTDDPLVTARAWIEPVVTCLVRYADVDGDPRAERPLLDVEEVITACAAALAAAVRAKGEADAALSLEMHAYPNGVIATPCEVIRAHAADVPPPRTP